MSDYIRHVQKVVKQPTKQSNIRVVVDRNSPSGIREVKNENQKQRN